MARSKRRGFGKLKIKGWYDKDNRKHKVREYFPDIQLRQSDKYWTVVNHNQFHYRKSNSIINPKITYCEYHDNREMAQTISHSYVNRSPLFDQLDGLYGYLSKRNDDRLTFNSALGGLIGLIERHIWWFVNQDFVDEPLTLRTDQCDTSCWMSDDVEPGNDDTVLLAFSGGRGSLATALFYRDQGKDVRLFHLRGINRALRDECEFAMRQAERLELPLYVENVRLGDGYYGNYIIHPLRNIAIANSMIHFAFDFGLPMNIAFGTFEMDMLSNNSFDACGCDCREMWSEYESAVRSVIPKFSVKTPLPHMGAAMERLLVNKSYLSMTTSCATEVQHRRLLRRRVMRFFNKELDERSCGVCWKCASDYIFRCDFGLDEPDYHYYIICLTILKARFDGEVGYPCHDINEIWNRFFFYNMQKSVFYSEILRAEVRDTGNISFPHHNVSNYYAFNSFKRVFYEEYKRS